MTQDPLILLTNDDGITKKGLAKLVELAANIGQCIVVAPREEQSGVGHAITSSQPLRVEKSTLFSSIEAHACSGTPADCVKVALNYLCDMRPHIVLSGINHGTNASMNVHYSGTLAGAREACLAGLPAIGFSLCDYNEEAEMSHIDHVVKDVIYKVLKEGIPHGIYLNVNLPVAQSAPLTQFRYCRQSVSTWQDKCSVRKDLRDQTYLWLDGEVSHTTDDPDSDQWALAQNYASIVPCLCDVTAYQYLKTHLKQD